MKHVIVPAAVKLVDPETKKPIKNPNGEEAPEFTIQRFNNNYVLSSSDIGRGIEGLRRAVRLENKFEGLVAGDVVVLDNEDYAAVMGILNKIEWPSPRVAAQFLPLLSAWADGEKQDEEWKRKLDAEKVEKAAPIDTPPQPAAPAAALAAPVAAQA